MKNNIKNIANIKGLKLNAIAEQLNISKSYFSLMISGHKKIPQHILDKLSDLFGCTYDQILGNREVDDNVANYSTAILNEEYIKITLEIIDDISNRNGLSFDFKDQARIIKEIYKIVFTFFSKSFNKEDVLNIIKKDIENPIIEGVHVAPLVISKLSI
jgi:transcriptional regulator with XRE-family HTH domain